MQQQKQPISIDLKQTTGIVCEECQNEVFVPGFFLRKVSKFLTGDSVDSLYPVQVMVCASCGHCNKEFLPLELQDHVDEPEA